LVPLKRQFDRNAARPGIGVHRPPRYGRADRFDAVLAMAEDHIRYDLLAQDALRGVVRTVLADAAQHGLPGEHHFYITFDTRAEGVRLSQRMRTQYPEDMTIVLQHQFWDLAVNEQAFEVGLSFGGIAERLTVPFVAIKGFADPTVQFGLQFERVTEAEGEAQGDAQTKSDGSAPAPPVAEHDKARPSVAVAASIPSPTPAEVAEKPAAGGEVVRLDRFRKK
jgi:hypothetical protein